MQPNLAFILKRRTAWSSWTMRATPRYISSLTEVSLSDNIKANIGPLYIVEVLLDYTNPIPLFVEDNFASVDRS